MRRAEIETGLNESRNWLLARYQELSPEHLELPLTKSEHDPENLWHALDHFAHLALIEDNFVAMVRRHVAGNPNPVGLLTNREGVARSREEVMASVHAMTDDYQRSHHGDSLSQVVALTARARAQTLQLLAELTDEQLNETLVGAPWADGTVGGVLGANASHARRHWQWVSEALERSIDG